MEFDKVKKGFILTLEDIGYNKDSFNIDYAKKVNAEIDKMYLSLKSLKEALERIYIYDDINDKEKDSKPLKQNIEAVKSTISKEALADDSIKAVNSDNKNIEFKNKNIKEVTRGDLNRLIDNQQKNQFLLSESFKAGLTSATIAMAFKMVPEIVKGINRLKSDGEITNNDIKSFALAGVGSALDGFLRGSIASYLYIYINLNKSGSFNLLKEPSVIGSLVFITIETVRNSIKVALGKMSAREMGLSFLDSIASSAIFTASMLTSKILIPIPVVGYLVGSLIGSTLCLTYSICKNKFISFCIDTGFTAFGLVSQDYEIPYEAAREMGLDLNELDLNFIDSNEVNYNELNNINSSNFDGTISYRSLRRGLIGINKIGFIYD